MSISSISGVMSSYNAIDNSANNTLGSVPKSGDSSTDVEALNSGNSNDGKDIKPEEAWDPIKARTLIDIII